MNVADYLIDPAGLEWPKLISTWQWLLPGGFTIWLMNRFGDLFLVLEDGTVHMLDVGTGTLRQVATSRDDFQRKIDEPGQANDWLMIPLVDDLAASGLRPAPGECYSYRQLPVLGGDYTVGNTVLRDIATHYAAFGPIHERLKDLADGAKITFGVEP